MPKCCRCLLFLIGNCCADYLLRIIDEKQYNIACEIDEDLLGKYVRFYYSEEDEAIKAVVPRKNNVLVISLSKIYLSALCG